MTELDFFDELAKKGYILTDLIKDNLLKYLSLVEETNKVMDLTANVEKEEIIEKNFYDSILSLSKFDYENKSLIDVGSGAGFPGMLYAIMCPSLKVTLLEPMNKRANFLLKVKEELKLENVEVVSKRAEDFASLNKESFDYGSARGVAKLNILLELITPMLKVGGIFIALKAKMAYEEEINAKNALSILNMERVHVEEFFLPTNKETRINLYYKKNKSTDKKYPRNFGQIKKKPL